MCDCTALPLKTVQRVETALRALRICACPSCRLCQDIGKATELAYLEMNIEECRCALHIIASAASSLKKFLECDGFDGIGDGHVADLFFRGKAKDS